MPTDPLLDVLAGISARQSGSRARRLLRHPLRSVLPIAMRRLELLQPRTVRTFWGEPLEVVLPEPVSTQAWRTGAFDPSTSAVLLTCLRAGCTVLDVGAHLGYFTALAAHLCGPDGVVVAVEPTPQTCAQLRRNVSALRSGADVRVVPMAASDAPGEVAIKDYGIVRSSLNTLHDPRTAFATGVPHLLEVPAVDLDSLLASMGTPAPDLVKIDAESSEDAVVRGLRRTISATHPTLVIEVGRDAFAADGSGPERGGFIALLLAEGYAAGRWDWAARDVVPADLSDATDYANLVFRHPRGPS